MKRSTLSLISLLLAIIMLAGCLASCKSDPTNENESTQTPAGSTSGDGISTESESEGNGDNGGDSDITGPSIDEVDNALLIENANALANGVNAYFTDGKRTDFVLENQNMKLEYALAAYKNQQITSIVNNSGNAYITNTSDVFVKMENGNVFYSSNSTAPATANLYRFGYYMYEARFEEQNFRSSPSEEGAINFSVENVDKNHVKTQKNSDGSLHVEIANESDPYILLRDVQYSANEYPYLQITLKANIKSVRGITVYLAAGSHTSLGSQTQSVVVSPTEEYQTYLFPLYLVNDYTGNVTKLRLDFAGKRGETYDIKEVKVVKASVDGTPDKLGLNRSFFVYSNKMHHMVQVATKNLPTTGIASIGVETRIDASTVAKLVVKDATGTHNTLEGVDWSTAEYVGFDVKDAGIFGYILPAGNTTDKLEVTLADGVYTIIQSRTPENGTIEPSGVYNSDADRIDALVDNNANDFFMGQRIYTDASHDFTTFLEEAFIERNPLTKDNFVISKRESSYESTFECPKCGFKSPENMLKCSNCNEEVSFIEHANMYFKDYDAIRGLYTFWVPSESFAGPFHRYPNKYINLTFMIKGDDHDRNIYFMTASGSGCLECAVLLDENKMMLPVPIEVGKNFSEAGGERNLWNIQDTTYGEAIIPMVILKGSQDKYTFLNLYQNWGQHPLKQVSWIQFYAPYYHLSTGVTETNCIVPYYSCKNVRGLGTLPDHRAMSAPLWAGQPQHTSGGSHRWLIYTDADGVYSASENTLDYIDSYGPVYADVYMDYLSDDGKIKVSYTHMEFPQTDENRAFYEMKYEVLGDVSFKDFSRDFCFYDVTDNDAKGSYINVGYLNADNECTIVDAAKGSESFKYVLGTESPYFSFFNMPDYDVNSTSAEGYVNLSFIIYNYDIKINGQKSDVRFAIINEDNRVRLSLDLGAVTLKQGDTITINAIVMPWGSQESVYDSTEFAGDQNVRDVRENTCLNPLTPTAVENAEIIDSVFLPKIKSTNGKTATFNLKGGENNVAVRVYGFNKLTVPKIQELVDGKWVDYQISSAYKPDRYGNASYFDGYSVHYDEDGTFSYAFIVPMDNDDADGRTFRVSLEESFTGWPRELPKVEIEAEELPLNVFVSAEDIYNNAKNEAGKQLGGITMSADGSYVTLSSNESAQEAYFHLWYGDGGQTVTGQYLVMKYRLPTSNNKKYTYCEFFTTTTPGASASGNCFSISNAFITDDQWHTLAIDLSTWNQSNFAVNDTGTFNVQFVRFDVYNDFYANGNSLDIEFFGISDSLEDILAYHAVDTVNVLTEKKKLTTYDKSGNITENPSDNQGSTTVEGFNYYLSTSDLTAAALSDSGHSGRTVSSADGKYVTIHYDTQRSRVESYINLFTGNSKVTGQYFVLKYRTSKQAGYIEIYTSTEADGASAAASIGGRTSMNGDSNYLFAADGEWHTVVIDLSKATKAGAFIPNANGEYVAKFIRIDLFNFAKATTEAFSVDLAFAGFCDNYEEAISHDENTWFFDGTTSIDVATGKPLTAPKPNGGNGGNIEDATSAVPGYNVYLDAADLTSTIKNTAWKDYGILSSDSKYVSVKNVNDASVPQERRIESYFSFISGNSKATGQYAVLKYRSNVQQGSITIWSSTQNASAASGNNFDLKGPGQSNGLFIADNEWHIVIVDLSKLIGTFTPTGGKYVATHLRVDFFNFDNPRDPADTQAIVDMAYIALCDDFTEILCSDKSVDEITFFNGQTYKYSTATGQITFAPEGGDNTEGEGTTPENPTQIYTHYYNATSIIKAAHTASDGSHAGGDEIIGGNVAKIYNCVDPSKKDVLRKEAYFYLLRNNTEATGRYLVIKYRSEQQVGCLQIYTSTEKSGASESGTIYMDKAKGLFIANGQWQIAIIDLEKATGSFSANASGEYVPTHLRVDLFNLDSPVTDTSNPPYVELEYVGLCGDYTAVLGTDTSVETVTFYDGSAQTIANTAK